jgi:D-alanyl-D-alanine carboxypeptidase
MTRLPRLIAGALGATLLSVTQLWAQAPAPPPAQPAALDAAALAGKIDELMAGHVKTNDFSGTILLAKDGTPLVAKGYGFANIEWQIPNGVDTKFRIGSVTKGFTSMLIMQLREQGKVKIEDSVCLYVTPCPEAWKPVTIHHLLTHTSGIPSYTGLPAWREVRTVSRTIDQMVALFRDLPLQWTPGEKYAYNNSGYFLLGVVIEKITGKKYEQALDEMILKPLGLAGTGYDWPGSILPKRAAGYGGRGSAILNADYIDMQQPYAAGAMYSTVGDLLKWDQALYTERLLPNAAKQTMWTPFKDNYAYGWQVTPPSAATFGHRRIVHGGGINGFSAMIIRLPDLNVTAIVLSNNMSVNAGAVARDLLALYFGQPYTVPAPRAVVSVPADLLEAYAGRYEVAPNFVITVTKEGDRLMAQATGQGKFELFAESQTRFFAKVTELAMTFVKGADGTVSHLLLMQGGKEQPAKRLPK